mgnify:CR=1 FL=1
MPINITMPALSPTMEEGNLAKWLVKEGDKVFVVPLMYGLDDRKFDRPLEVDLTRKNPIHAGFGNGPHRCPGSFLARVEIRAMFSEVLSRLHDMELAGPVERLRSNFINGPRHMPVRFRAH